MQREKIAKQRSRKLVYQFDKEGEQLENYTKYKLKSNDELAELLADKDHLFVVACNKCFKEFETIEEPECGEFEKFAAEQGKTVTGSVKVDFLCNKTQTEKKLQDIIPEGTENVIVISCGLGIQTVADLAGKPVYAASNSLNYTGHHGMALTKKSCDACAQCYLNLTGGICPIVDCSKSLVNGQCGGAKDGKCEVDGNKDCAWEKIYRRLEKQGRLEEFLNQPVQLRDYSKTNFKVINDYVKAVREERFAGYYGGVHPSERKEFSEHLSLKRFPEPKTVVISMSQHLGAPANPIVQVGDTVKVGQKIGEASAFISAPVHSSVSGTVVAVEPRLHATRGGEVMAVVIESDGKNTLHESVKPHKGYEDLTPDEIIEIVREAGIVGMGGAGFPTRVKLSPKEPDKIDYIIANCAECEPYITADYRRMLENTRELVNGMRIVLSLFENAKGIFGVEDNKPDCIAKLKEAIKDEPRMEVKVLQTKYPQGAERQLIYATTKRAIHAAMLPADAGCIVDNVETLIGIHYAVVEGRPLTERIVTVSGDAVQNPGNYKVLLGTNHRELIEAAGGWKEEPQKLISGGPMMGFAMITLDAPVTKTSSAILAFKEDIVAKS